VRGEEKSEERRVLHGEAIDRGQDLLYREVDEQVAGLVPVSRVAEGDLLSVDVQLGSRPAERLVGQRPPVVAGFPDELRGALVGDDRQAVPCQQVGGADVAGVGVTVDEVRDRLGGDLPDAG
jgi:hypothetical protein